MPRKGNQSQNGAVLSYYEKKKSSIVSKIQTRISKDSCRKFDCCSLTLQPCRKPVITTDGYLYDRESILENIIQQKADIARKLKAYNDEQIKLEEKEKNAQERAKTKDLIEKFSVNFGPSVHKGGILEESISNMKQGKDEELPGFWLPSKTPSAKMSKLEKPDEFVRCPMTRKPLKFKDLIEVKFTPVEDGTPAMSKEVKYVCPVTGDVLGDSVPCAVLKTSGSVVTMECVMKVIKKDMIDPVNGKKLREKDIIPLQRGSSGFAGAGHNLVIAKEGYSTCF